MGDNSHTLVSAPPSESAPASGAAPASAASASDELIAYVRTTLDAVQRWQPPAPPELVKRLSTSLSAYVKLRDKAQKELALYREELKSIYGEDVLARQDPALCRETLGQLSEAALVEGKARVALCKARCEAIIKQAADDQTAITAILDQLLRFHMITSP